MHFVPLLKLPSKVVIAFHSLIHYIHSLISFPLSELDLVPTFQLFLFSLFSLLSTLFFATVRKIASDRRGEKIMKTTAGCLATGNDLTFPRSIICRKRLDLHHHRPGPAPPPASVSAPTKDIKIYDRSDASVSNFSYAKLPPHSSRHFYLASLLLYSLSSSISRILTLTFIFFPNVLLGSLQTRNMMTVLASPWQLIM